MWIHGVAASSVGAVRAHQEDAAFFAVAGEMALAVVADGMGGGSSGRPAADRTVAVARATFARRFLVMADLWWQGEHGTTLPDAERTHVTAHVRELWTSRRAQTPGDVAVLERGLVEIARRSVVDANRAIHEQSMRDRRMRGQGSTVEIAVLAPGWCAIGHVGDSRIYRLRAGRLEQRTEDHSLLNDYKKAKLLTPEEIESFPHKNVIVRALGMKDQVDVDVELFAVDGEDTLLLCSDGLFTTLDAARIQEVLERHGAEAAAHLVDEAKQTSEDNVTAITLAF